MLIKKLADYNPRMDTWLYTFVRTHDGSLEKSLTVKSPEAVMKHFRFLISTGKCRISDLRPCGVFEIGTGALRYIIYPDEAKTNLIFEDTHREKDTPQALLIQTCLLLRMNLSWPERFAWNLFFWTLSYYIRLRSRFREWQLR